MRIKVNSIFVFFTLIITVVVISCRSESDELIVSTQNESIAANSKAASLILRTSENNGNVDDGIDNTSCFSIKIPFTITANSQEIALNSQEDVDQYNDIFDDTDEIIFNFPITLIFNDFSEITVNTQDQFNENVNACENIDDDTIECIDFSYPFSASVFDSQSELIETISFENDKELYQFVDDLSDTDIATINFPITVIFSNNTEIIIDNLDNLEETIENVTDDDCDLDDDDNNNDNTDIQRFSEILTDHEWEVLKYKDNENNETKNYKDFEFEFLNDGSVTIKNDETDEITNGTWIASVNADSNLEIDFDFGSEVPLNKLNGLWEVKKAIEDQIKLERTNGTVSKDQLFFKND
ncbi:hypothetical protein U6A24_03425 [Aquimarina gracilis]|uniref:Uncharacterized protein n=1 Tax=Aquimarina gracilis TaxID=874422 RepID=A0ABU5ZRE3_9FLAO|nr:hypothetical protein [Aquimarina gracilis]MEB3344494.1 hypothetical protein [Aquimarina gracilis]